MSRITASQSSRTSPIMAIPVHCLVVPLRRCGQDTEPMCLLPLRRLSAAILPIIGGSPLASKPSLDLRGSVVSEGFGKAHGQTLPRKNKSAMRKMALANRRQCRYVCAVMKLTLTSKNSSSIHRALKKDWFNDGSPTSGIPCRARTDRQNKKVSCVCDMHERIPCV
jgi:hypothetical protein